MKSNKVYLLLVLLCTFMQGAKAQDVVEIVDQGGLEYAIENNSTVKIIFWQDIELSKILSIGDGKNITIDLNGKTLSRNLVIPADDGGVIRVETGGQLTIMNSNSEQDGLITGGKSTNGGGITNHGELTLESGRIMFCEATSSGGAIWNDGTLTINGGVITQNHSDKEGGAIWNNGTLTINGGTIAGNQSATVGGGIWNDGTLNMKGYFYIWENTGSTSDGNNTSNVYLNGKTLVNVTGSFQDGATIGVTINTGGQIITNGYKAHNPNADADTYFHSDKTSKNLTIVDDELILGTFVTFDECSWDDENKVVVTKTRTLPAIKLEGSHPDDWTGLNDGYYFVEGNVSYKVLNILGEDVHLVLTDGSELYCNHIKLEEGHTLSIYSQSDDAQTRGKLKAENALVTSDGRLKWVYTDAAAIGGGSEGAHMGTLYIHGGDILAQYSRNGALIGGGSKGSIKGRLVIYRGKVYANYSAFGSAIGGGYAASQGNSVFIYGGDVTADAKWCGAGIGGGKKQDSDDLGGNGGIVRIFGGTVHAYGGFWDDDVESLRQSGAGIGGGYRGRGGDVYISGGEVYAYGGYCSAGIGGSHREEGGKLVVSGGTVYATSPNYGQRYQAPAIGGGWYGVGAEVHITGGIVKVSNRIIKGDNAAPIGGGFEKSDGPLDIAPGMKVSYNSTEAIPDDLRKEYIPTGELTEANYGERALKCQDHANTYVIIEPCQHDKTFIYSIDDEYTHTTTCSLCGHTVKELHDVSSGDCVCGIKAENMSRTFTYYVPGDEKNTYEESANYTLTVGKRFYLFENPIPPEGYEFIGWQMNADPESANYNQWTAVKDDVILNPGSPVDVTVDMTNTTFHARFLYLLDAEWQWSENNTEYESTVSITHPDLISRALKPEITSEEIKDEEGEVIGIHYFGTATLTIDGYTYTFRDEWTKYDRIRIALADNADNTAMLETNNGRHADVTLVGRTFWGDGSWNTICLPFDVADITTTPLHSATIKALISTDYDEENGTLTLNFGDATTSLNAGTPYIFRYPQPEHYGEEGYSYDKTDPIFDDVVIRSDAAGISGTEYVDFVGSFSPVSLVANDKSVLYLGADNTLYYPSASFAVNSCRAVFRLTHGLTAGKNPIEGDAFTRSFVLNFGDDDNDITGIRAINDGQRSVKNIQWSFNDGPWYSLDGRKLNGMPTQKGIYINNGRKVVIK